MLVFSSDKTSMAVLSTLCWSAMDNIDDGRVPRIHDDTCTTQATFMCLESHRGWTIHGTSSIRTYFTIRPKHPAKCCLGYPVPDDWAPIVAGYRSSIPHTGNSFQEIAGQVPLPSIHYRYLRSFFIRSCSYTRLPEEQSLHFPCCFSINPNTVEPLIRHTPRWTVHAMRYERSFWCKT